MAAERETLVPSSFKMTDAIFWRNEMKVEFSEDYEVTKNRLFAILGWLGQVSLGNSFMASSDLVSYIKFSISKCVLNYSASIFINYNRSPYEENTLNEWFDLTPEEDWPERGEAVKAINVDKNGLAQKCYRTQNQDGDSFPDSLEDDEFEVFFHGTSHESAQDIIEGEIDLRRGAQKQDFSDGDGFYLSKQFDEALRRAQHRRTSSAVLVFRIKKTELRGDNNDKGYNLQHPDMKKEWQDVVRKFRNGMVDSKSRKEMNRQYQFIEGPMASISGKNSASVSYPRQKDDSYQLCVRTESCAKLFDRGLHSVVFSVK